MKKALNIYHLINFLHVIFYTYIAAQVLNVGNVHALLVGYYRYILIGYIIFILALRFLARRLGEGLINPMHTVSWAKHLNFAGIAALVLGVIMSNQIDPGYIFLVPISVPLSAVAFVLAYRGSPEIKEEDNTVLDEISDE